MDASAKQFIAEISSRAKTVNKEIISERQRMLTLEKKYHAHQKINARDISWLRKLAREYNIKSPNFQHSDSWHLLELRVDEVPPSLVTAQAINESAWGRSHFASKVNNYFGQHCAHKDCGIVPKNRPVGATFEVARFLNMTESVKSYIHNLNTNSYYVNFRLLRLSMRKKDQPLDAISLAEQLVRYAKHPQYSDIIQGIMKKYNLLSLDGV